jgi:hypothetical protein
MAVSSRRPVSTTAPMTAKIGSAMASSPSALTTPRSSTTGRAQTTAQEMMIPVAWTGARKQAA